MTPLVSQNYRQLGEHIPKGSRVVIYGSGAFGQTMYRLLAEHRPDVTVDCFVDSFKRGTALSLDVVLPEDLAGRKYDRLLIASAYCDDIVNNLPNELRQRSVIADQRLNRIFERETGDRLVFPGIGLEATRYCDMTCDFCTHKIFPGINRHMDMDLARLIIRQIAESGISNRFEFTGYGEPLCNPRIEEIIAEGKRHGLEVLLCTNGLALSPERYRSLHGSGLDILCVSMQNFSQAGFDHRRAKNHLPFETYRARILQCLEQHVAEGYGNKLLIKFMFTKQEWMTTRLWHLTGIEQDTKNRVPLIKAFIRDLEDVGKRCGKPLNLTLEEVLDGYQAINDIHGYPYTIPDIFENVSLIVTPLRPQEFRAMNILTPDTVAKFQFHTRKEYDCLTYTPIISIDGEVFPCCKTPFDPTMYDQFAMGRITKETSLQDILRGKKFTRFLRDIEHGRLTYPVCRECRGYYTPKENS